MALEIQRKEVFGVGITNLSRSGWQDCGSGVVYELTEDEEKFKRAIGNSYLEKIWLGNDESIFVNYQIRVNTWDTDWPPLHMFDLQTIELKNVEKIDRFFRPGCLVGKKTIFRRKP